MTVNELVETAITQPLSLLGDGKFYVVSFTESEIKLRGYFGREVLGLIPARMQNAGQVSIDGSGFVNMRVKTTTPRVGEFSECYWLEIALSVGKK